MDDDAASERRAPATVVAGSGGVGGEDTAGAGASGSSSSSSSGGSGGMGSGSKPAASAAAGRTAGGNGAAGAPAAAIKPTTPAKPATPTTSKGELYKDDFEDGNATMPSWIDADPELGGKWQVVAADGGKALAQTADVSDWVIAAGGDYRWTDQVVEARVKITAEPGKAGIFARLQDTRNYYFLYLDGGSNLVLRKRIDNSSGDIQKVKVESTMDTWYTLKLSVIGDQLTGYLDGKMLVSGSDSGVSSGGIGVGTADCTAQFDDITVHGS